MFKGDLLPHGNWVVANVETSIGWPVKVTQVLFRDRAIYLIPYTRDDDRDCTYPAAANQLNGEESFESGQILLSHFLSSVSWVERSGIQVQHWSGGGFPRTMGGCSTTPTLAEGFYQPYLPDPQDREPRWALAFYREGLSLNHVAYQCLSFFKVLNIFLRSGKDQISWINARLGDVVDHRAKSRISLLQSQEQDVGEYLYGSNRCAVTHAGGEPTADPENPEDLRRLREDLPLAQALAEIGIERHFGVKSASTVWREHYYELAGFKEIFGAAIWKRIKNTEEISENEWPPLPKLSVRLHARDRYEPLEGMTATIVASIEGVAIVHCIAENQLTKMALGLNFAEERLLLDIVNGLSSQDDGSETAVRNAVTVAQFEHDYIMNGMLEVWNTESEQLLSRCDAFIPINLDMHGAHRNYQDRIQSLIAEADARAFGEVASPDGDG